MATLVQGSEGKLPHLSTVTRLSEQGHFITKVNTNLSPLSKPTLAAGFYLVPSSNPMHKHGEENPLLTSPNKLPAQPYSLI